MTGPHSIPPAHERDVNLPADDAPEEAERQRVLDRYDILDTPAESAFDRVTELVARILNVPVVMLGFVDGDRVWFKSSHGLATDEMRRELSLCGQIVEAGGGCESADTAHDPLWKDHPLVAGSFAMRSFLAVPLVAPGGAVLGSLCVVDRRPRAWLAADRATLGNLAGIVMDELELRRQARARRRTEQEAAEARYQDLFEASPQPMWVYDLETLRFLAVNRAAIDLYGYSREQFLGGMTLADIRPVEDVPALLENVHRPRHHEDGRLLWRHWRRDGRLMDVEITSNDLTTYGGRPARLVMAYDVSERLRSAQAMRQRDRYLAALVEVQRELLRYPTVRPALDRVLALLGEASGASRVYFFTHQVDPSGGSPFLHEETYWRAPGVAVPGDLNAKRVRADEITPVWTEALARGEPVQAYASRLGGTERQLLDLCGARAILLAPLLVHGQLHGSLGFAHTDEERLWDRVETSHLLLAASALALALEREQGARALAEETHRLTITLSALAEGVITTDAEGRVVLLNRAAETLTGCLAAEGIGRPLREIFRTYEEAEGGEPRACGATGSSPKRFSPDQHRRRVWLEGRGGQRRLIDKVSIPVLDDVGQFRGVVRVFHDVTDQERLAAEMLKASKLESLGILAGGIAHDFNNILTAILGNVSLARRDCAGLPGDDKLDQAERACARARDLTGQLLTFARGGAPSKKFARLPEIIRESVGFALHGSPVRVSFDLPAGLWPVEADAGQLSQVLNNLAINAVQAMGTGGGNLGVRAKNLELAEGTLPALSAGRYVKISVEDEGCGVSGENLEKIFDPFFTTKEGGSGLGLATSYSIAKRHGGHLNVDSVPGVGSTFRLFLPATAEKEGARNAEEGGQSGEAHAAVPTAPASTTHAAHPLRVLVLEDELTIQTLLGDMLAHLGAEVVVTAVGTKTIEAYRQARAEGCPYDLLILDLTVPGGMGGREVLAALREEDPDVHAIVSSGYAHDSIVSHYAQHGFAGVLSKPYRLGEVSAVLRAVTR